ncbi:hypothetical protein PALB_37860 [Pseudoalteromonas luteoviolacea B = ATCC 29581]|nr:hypothetical protein PALB_37860 [Pseudoalteromonas luteoviolacea B = ATCC 29581]
MKLLSLHTAFALALSSCAWVAHADPIIYNFSYYGQLNTGPSTEPATIEGTLTLNDNPTAPHYIDWGSAQLLNWYFTKSPIIIEYGIILDGTGDVVVQNAYSPYMVSTGLSNGTQSVTMGADRYASGGWTWYGTVTDPSSVMTMLSNDSETGQKLSEVIDLFKVSNLTSSSISLCIPGEPFEYLPGQFYTPCVPAYFYPSSLTMTGGNVEPQPDADGDGINDAEPLVLIAGLETDVPNYMLTDGVTSLSQGIAAKLEESKVLAVEVSSYMAAYLNELKDAGIITGKEKGKLQSAISKAKGK